MTMEKESIWENPCPSATVPTTNITWTVLGSNPSLPDEEADLTPGALVRY